MTRAFPFGWIVLLALTATVAEGAALPNVVIIYADDIGYGDISCNGARPGLTPNVDRLAKEGLRFTDGHCTSATCTPSRYGLLTGEYPWRKKGTGVLPGDARMIIEPGRTTLATVLRQAGYRTGVVGKWHLGLGAGDLDWNGEITPSPLDIGFDESFIMAATGDRVPCVYVRDRRVVGLDPADPIEVRYGQPIPGEPTGKQNPELLKVHPSHGHDMAIVNGVSRIGHMKGGRKALWIDEEMADVFTKEAVDFIGRHKAKPFFLYFATHDVHVPRVPHPRFVGKSGMGPRGDALLEFDWSVSEILKTLDEAGLTENTLVLLSSDNGPVIDDGYKDDAVEKLGDHKPAGPFRGGKYSKFEAGTRVPWIVRWPAKVRPGVSDALMCQVDFVATFAALVGQPTSVATARDSENYLPALLGDSKTGRKELVEHGNGLALRDGPWKWIPGSKGPAKNGSTNTELGNAPEGMLFNLSADPGERDNVASAHADIVARLQARLTELQK
ncbi:sulfatase family protein [Planctomyces sp. SH-PL14]|uniref:sulfatase family protein n=1 Tax=Planctomyces sp. SH-PL14 TaxID=1632864 RepID=UPI00078BC2CC|nr:arylsulfatase [Planctomyces sp. SH-PL14]AMV16284.1 Arylsulfatase precursor [Planctomyces sp. SH-PL14]